MRPVVTYLQTKEDPLLEATLISALMHVASVHTTTTGSEAQDRLTAAECDDASAKPNKYAKWLLPYSERMSSAPGLLSPTNLQRLGMHAP